MIFEPGHRALNNASNFFKFSYRKSRWLQLFIGGTGGDVELTKFNSCFRETQIDPKWRETFVLSCHRPRTLPPSITTWSKASCHPLSRLCLPILLVMCAGKSFSTLGTTCWKQAASFHQELPFMLSMGKSSQIMAGTNNQLFITIAIAI